MHPPWLIPRVFTIPSTHTHNHTHLILTTAFLLCPQTSLEAAVAGGTLGMGYSAGGYLVA